MKIVEAIGKNLKLLFRSKESAYTILFGPLLIILVVSFAFMGSSDDYAVRVGVHERAHTSLSERTVATLNDKGYQVSVYPDEDSCVASVREGTSHACLVFGEGQEGNESVPVTFYLDFSRVNIVYRILDDLSGQLDIQSDAIRAQLTSGAIARMQTAAGILDEGLNLTVSVEQRLDAIAGNISLADASVAGIPNGTANASDLAQLGGYQQGLASYVRAASDQATPALRDAKSLILDLESECSDCSDAMKARVDDMGKRIDDAQAKIGNLAYDVTPRQLAQANLALSIALDEVGQLQAEMANASSAGMAVHEGVGTSAADAAQARDDLAQVEARLRYTRDFLRGERVDPSVVSSPIQTSIVSVTSSADTLSFAYPYLLVLVIMFIGMLLSSMLIVTDKTSRAAFRNFTTPTPDRYHVTMAFLTAFCILIAEIAVILFVSGFFVAQPLLRNLGTTLTIVCVAIAVFTFLGMIVGYLSSTQEAAMISSISIASVLLFVSNLVVPIEGMASAVRALSAFNPYIVLSELLKRSMLYGVGAGQLARELLVMLAFLAALVLLTLLVQRSIKRRYFREEQPLLSSNAMPSPLALGDREVHDEIELMDALDAMTRAQFDAIMAADDGAIARWVEAELGNKRLGRQLRAKSKEKMILRLDAYLRRHGKRMRRGR